ncbi:efflux RND transporter periplasmic adaptor subunit [Bremerella sp. P1]|uniref:efflux RND transporter periplasmic adaptor subunit n=1 Tax=Bremerella sp. P1 TaxID=3026424 RepID=UPI00236824FC|nr:efflux RND transporter periplasmic adaptor subunit [Bremerella sp. P1]WDI39927.1 efflux RND transporter periplasmic adaptor subunit [Bremerella sp. P1]
MAEVDLKQLAIDRGATAADRSGKDLPIRHHFISRVLIPGILVAGFVALVVWASWDLIFPAMPVKVVPVVASKARIQSAGTPLFQAAGWVEPRPIPIRVAALSPGVIEELLVVEDQAVSKGDPVANLVREDNQLAYERAIADRDLRQAEVDQAQAALDAANIRVEQPVHLEAQLAEAEAQVSRIDTQLQNLPFEVRRAEAMREYAKLEHQRKVDAGIAVSKLTVEEAVSRLATAEATLEELIQRKSTLQAEKLAWSKRQEALKTQLDLLVDEMEAKATAQAELQAAKARLRQAEVALAQAKLALDRMVVRAPVAGRIYQLLSPPGTHLGTMPSQRTESDSSTVVTMYRPDSLQVRVDVRFENIPQVSLDQQVTINNPALDEPIVGRVLFISSEADIQKNTLQVKVALPDPPNYFKPEMLVDVTFLAPEVEQKTDSIQEEMRIYIPSELVLSEDGQAFVWRADQAAGKARKTSITVAATPSGPMTEVLSGLNLGDRLIFNPSPDLQENTAIQVIDEVEESSAMTTQNRVVRSTLHRLPPQGE